jgi:hypothetical protein
VGDRIRRGARVLATEVDGETVMLALDTGLYHSLEGVAARIWELLETPSSAEETARVIAGQYGVPVTQCEADILEFFQDLLRADLVVVEPR